MTKMDEEQMKSMSPGERLLVELNLAVKYLTDAFEKFQKSMDERYKSIELSKLDRHEFDIIKRESDRAHTNFELRIKALETNVGNLVTALATLGGQIRLGAWIIGILALLGPVLAAIILHVVV